MTLIRLKKLSTKWNNIAVECLDVQGIPILRDEDTNKLVSKVGDLVDVDIKTDDISISHQLPAPNSNAAKKSKEINSR